MPDFFMLEHGGRLRAAALQYGIPANDWLDLSAAINPVAFPVGDMPADIWQRLPEDDDGLEHCAARFYGNNTLLAVAGSQAAIQVLPSLINHNRHGNPLRVGVLTPTYNEHPHAWQQAGHTLVPLTSATIDSQLDALDALVLVNPNNPTGEQLSRSTLLQWHQRLAAHGGWLVVDEAFADAAPQHSLMQDAHLPGLIVLRSLGKFFGLAGARVGFVFAQQALLHALRKRLGPWPISHPSRIAAMRALADIRWQQQQRQQLPRLSQRLSALLSAHGLAPCGGCALFQWIQTEQAAAIHQQLAQQGILTRLYREPASLRLGLPAHEDDWQRLAIALAGLART